MSHYLDTLCSIIHILFKHLSDNARLNQHVIPVKRSLLSENLLVAIFHGHLRRKRGWEVGGESIFINVCESLFKDKQVGAIKRTDNRGTFKNVYVF